MVGDDELFPTADPAPRPTAGRWLETILRRAGLLAGLCRETLCCYGLNDQEACANQAWI